MFAPSSEKKKWHWKSPTMKFRCKKKTEGALEESHHPRVVQSGPINWYTSLSLDVHPKHSQWSISNLLQPMCIYIWVNYNISLTWNKVIWGWFPLLTIIPSEVAVRSERGRYNLPRYMYAYIYIVGNIPPESNWGMPFWLVPPESIPPERSERSHSWCRSFWFSTLGSWAASWCQLPRSGWSPMFSSLDWLKGQFTGPYGLYGPYFIGKAQKKHVFFFKDVHLNQSI